MLSFAYGAPFSCYHPLNLYVIEQDDLLFYPLPLVDIY